MFGDDFKVKEERSGFRDEGKISKWHRTLGYNCPMTNVDIILTLDGNVHTESFTEYDSNEPVAFFEYKHETAYSWKLTDSSIQVQRNIASRCGLPFFIVRYADDLSWFKLKPANLEAIQILAKYKKNPDEWVKLSEVAYVQFLYSLRGRRLPAEIKQKLIDKRNVVRVVEDE